MGTNPQRKTDDDRKSVRKYVGLKYYLFKLIEFLFDFLGPGA
jgi:hypothetical protein